MKSRRDLLVILVLILVVSVSVLLILPFLLEPPADNRPELVVSYPVKDSTVTGMVNFNISIIDEEDLTANIYIDGQFRTSSNNYEWNTEMESDGRHTIRISTQDSAGQSDSTHFEVTIDNVEEDVFFEPLFKIMVYNIKESGLNDDWKEIIKQENPDVIVLVETGYFDNTSNETLNAATAELNEFFADEVPYDSYTTQQVQYSTTGEAILSRFPVLSFTQIDTVPLDDESNYYVTHDFIDAVIDINGAEVHVFGAHLKASGGETNQGRREVETEGIINYMDNLGDVPILYLGDQNSFSPDDVGDLAPQTTMTLGYGPMTMLLYPNHTTYGQYSSEVHNYTDVYRELNPDDPGFTFGGQDGEAFMRIDYIIANTFFDGAFINSSVVDGTPADSASDHYAVAAWVNWTVLYEPTQSQRLSADSATKVSEVLPVRIENPDQIVELIAILPLEKIEERCWALLLDTTNIA
ncbi:hypothetical protein EU537_08310 [Candidatus Thorarchaeota archaeon]|nr:MAG: hypothetical protein EU537_08310 [Candidatus Thorarchaeota archaeon]